jgi:uncharacterized coiled-coil DUF342 family protein
MRLELADARSNSSGPDPKVSELQGEIERIRYQLASARAEAGQLRDERDEYRHGIEHALEQIEKRL